MRNRPSPFTIYGQSFQAVFGNFSTLVRYFGIFALFVIPGAFMQSFFIQASLFQSLGSMVEKTTIASSINNTSSLSDLVSEINIAPLTTFLEDISTPLIIGVVILLPIGILLFSALLFLSKWTAAARLTTQESLSIGDCFPRLGPVGKFAIAHLLQILLGLALIIPLILVGVVLALLNPWLLLLMPILTLAVGVFFFLVFWIWLILSAPAIFVDGKGPMDALKTSYRLTRGAEAPLFLTALLFFLTFLIVNAVSAPLNLIASFEPITSSIVSAGLFLVQTGVSLASYTAITKWYIALRDEEE